MSVDEKKIDKEKHAKETIEKILKTYNELTPEEYAKIPQLAQIKTGMAFKKIYVVGHSVTYIVKHNVAYAIAV